MGEGLRRLGAWRAIARGASLGAWGLAWDVPREGLFKLLTECRTLPTGQLCSLLKIGVPGELKKVKNISLKFSSLTTSPCAIRRT